MKRFLAAGCLAVCLAAFAAAQASAAPITISYAGATGTWGGEIARNVCDYGLGFGASVTPVEPFVNRTPSYPSQVQTIRMFSRIEYWNGSAWAYYTQDANWSSRTVSPGQMAFFTTHGLNVREGLYYRVVQFYEWYVNGVRVGTVTNLFDQSEYQVLGGSVGSTNQGGYCYIN